MKIREEDRAVCFECHRGTFSIPDGNHIKCDNCGALVAKKLIIGGDSVGKFAENKPDPDEPFRYVCPDCRTQVRGKISSGKYECNSCGEYFEKEELVDKKKEDSFDDPRDVELFKDGSETLLECIIEHCEEKECKYFKLKELDCVEDGTRWTNNISELHDKGIVDMWTEGQRPATWVFDH